MLISYENIPYRFRISLNTDEAEYMVVSHKRQDNYILCLLEVNLNRELIKRAQKVKYLGNTVDENLTWNEQYKSLKVKSAMLSSPVLKSLLDSHLRYSDEPLGYLSNTKLDHLQLFTKQSKPANIRLKVKG